MKRLIYQVAVGNPSKLYEHCISSVTRYCEKHNITQIVQRTPILRIKPDVFATNRSVESYEKHGGFLPIYEKENAFDHFGTFDQIAIIDADIYIRDSAPNIFDDFGTEHEFGAVAERDLPLTDSYQRKILNYSRMQYSSFENIDWQWSSITGGKFYNMGMMIMNKSFWTNHIGQDARTFITRPEFKPFIDGMGAWKWSTDQTLLNWYIRHQEVKIKDMSWKWNSLFTAVRPEAISEAHFVHFFLKDKLPEKGENVEELMRIIL